MPELSADFVGRMLEMVFPGELSMPGSEKYRVETTRCIYTEEDGPLHVFEFELEDGQKFTVAVTSSLQRAERKSMVAYELGQVSGRITRPSAYQMGVGEAHFPFA